MIVSSLDWSSSLIVMQKLFYVC